ncbi:MAG TPA: MATE family efflux transporter [Nitrospirota bacterium]|nr:MATE family efflux transporter [Nitrospirota bacterium]
MQKNIRQQVFSLALPVVLSSLLQRSVGIVDIFLVGGLGASAIAAVGIVQIMVFVTMSLSWGINVGVTVLVSQLWGAGRKSEAAQAAYQAMLLAVAAAGLIMFLGLSFGGRVATLLGAAPAVQGMIGDYTRIIFTFILFTISINVISGIMHGTGDTRTPLYSTLLVNILHVVVAYPLIYGHLGLPALGVKGAAIAVVISESMGAVFLFVRSLHKRYIIITRRIELKFTVMTFKLGLPILVDRLLQNAGSLVFAKIILLYGTAVYAAHQVGLAIEAFSFMPGYGIAVAAATMVGQNLGADRPADARLSAYEANRLAVILMAGMGLIFFFFPYGLLRAFTSDPEVIRYGILYMKIVAFAQIPLAITMVAAGSLRGAGDTGFIMFATIAGMWFVRLPFAAALAVFWKAEIRAVWSVMILDWLVRMGLLLWRYRKQSWGKLEI